MKLYFNFSSNSNECAQLEHLPSQVEKNEQTAASVGACIVEK